MLSASLELELGIEGSRFKAKLMGDRLYEIRGKDEDECRQVWQGGEEMGEPGGSERCVSGISVPFFSFSSSKCELETSNISASEDAGYGHA